MSALNGVQSGPATWRPGRGGLLRRLRRDDRGAVATIFGILLAGGVLLGMLALVVDVGQLYAEREELQTGADATALAIAKSCAADLNACTTSNAADIARKYAAEKNARDSAAEAWICVPQATPINILPFCESRPPAENLTKCLEKPNAPKRYIEVRTTTALPDGSTLLPPSFAQTLLGNGGYKGATVRACARVAWGAAKAGLAVTFSKCEWNSATNNGTDFPPAPPYPPNSVPRSRYEVVLMLHDSQGNPSCPAGPPGSDRPGGFGWLNDGSTEDCNTDTFTADPGNDPPAPCVQLLNSVNSQETAKVVFIPIYESVTGTGKNAKYVIKWMEGFVPTGYYFGEGNNKSRASWLTGRNKCSDPGSNQERCIYGYFVNQRVTGVEIGDLETVSSPVISLIG